MEYGKEDGYNAAVEGFRGDEYPMLKDSIYLDHAGTTLYSKTFMERFSKDMMSNLFGNPHSGSTPSQKTTSRIEDVRLRLLQFFKADPEEFDLVFVANTTAAVKLVLEAFRNLPGGFTYAYHQACHTSLVGAREEANQSICLDTLQIGDWANGQSPFSGTQNSASNILFSYTGQSHMDGQRYPLSWSADVRKAGIASSHRVYSLLDAASLAATSPLDFTQSEGAPDFTVLSLYKIFGFPDLGALIVRRQAESVFQFRRYFGGGTVAMVACGKEQWHTPKTDFLHERLEDGTLPFHNIIALDSALDTHRGLFGPMEQVSAHTSFLTRRLIDGLTKLRHGNGTAVCTMYTRLDAEAGAGLGCGPIVAFNLRNSEGGWVSLNEFEKLTTLKNFDLRTGGVCSPGGIANALGLEPWELRRNFSAGFRCGSDQDIIAGKPTGIIRASLGAMSIQSDVDKFIAFIDEFYRDDNVPTSSQLESRDLVPGIHSLQVRALTVYPIKSCAGYAVPKGVEWEVRPEGLAWDREWCLVHRGTGQALSQKRYLKMALIRPSLDFAEGVLRVTYHGSMPEGIPTQVCVPLSNAFEDNMECQQKKRGLRSRVCGDSISTQSCNIPQVDDFFSAILDVPCMLARFPAGGQGLSMRHSKAQFQKHQSLAKTQVHNVPGAFPELPSPPDSDSEQQKANILLSNESPILLIYEPSLDLLNCNIKANGGDGVPVSAFRGNVVVGPSAGQSHYAAYAEDDWLSLQIGSHSFTLMGACRRCQMVCVDQESGQRREEPYTTLAKTRRFDGKVYFGAHMRHRALPAALAVPDAAFPRIRVGDSVQVDP